MITFKQFLQERQTSTFVFCFGRYSPPTRGHIFHFKAVQNIAVEHAGDYIVYVSKTFDNKKNPVPVQDKIEYIKKAIPDLNVEIATNMFGILGDIIEQGSYSNIIYVAGGDYFSNPAERAMLDRLIAEAQKAGITMKVQSSGERSEGISGTALRNAVKQNDIETFIKASPVGIGTLTQQDAANMFKIVQQNLR